MHSTQLLFAVCALLVATNCLDLRVTKTIGARNEARISVIDTNPDETYNGFFDYNKQFQWKWTDKALHSTVKRIDYNGTTFSIGGQQVTVNPSNVGATKRGIIFGDPCVNQTGFYKPCSDDTGTKLPALLNAAASSIDFWMILGDNWYDRVGNTSTKVFADFSLELKSKYLFTVPGNHDFWILGNPTDGIEYDQFGAGFMQFYAQDVYASKNAAANGQVYNLTNQPTLGHLPAAENFFHYSQLGGVGFIGYSGAHSWEEQEYMFEEACDFFRGEPHLYQIVLYSHWSFEDDGCQPGMNTTKMYSRLQSYAGCGHRNTAFINVYGHTHCNKKISDTEFLIGAAGYGGECDDVGIVYFETIINSGTSLVLFPFKDPKKYAEILECFKNNDVSKCTHLGRVWR